MAQGAWEPQQWLTGEGELLCAGVNPRSIQDRAGFGVPVDPGATS